MAAVRGDRAVVHQGIDKSGAGGVRLGGNLANVCEHGDAAVDSRKRISGRQYSPRILGRSSPSTSHSHAITTFSVLRTAAIDGHRLPILVQPQADQLVSVASAKNIDENEMFDYASGRINSNLGTAPLEFGVIEGAPVARISLRETVLSAHPEGHRLANSETATLITNQFRRVPFE